MTDIRTELFNINTANSTANVTIKDVLGSRSDTSFSNNISHPSVMGHLMANFFHIHNASRVYPRTDDDTPLASVTLISDETSLTFGNYVELIASTPYVMDIHFMMLGELSSNDEYTIQIGIGAAGAETFWGESWVVRDTNQMRIGMANIQGEPIPAGTRVSARLATLGGSSTAKVKIFTHRYPDIT